MKPQEVTSVEELTLQAKREGWSVNRYKNQVLTLALARKLFHQPLPFTTPTEEERVSSLPQIENIVRKYSEEVKGEKKSSPLT